MTEQAQEQYDVIEGDDELHVISVAMQAVSRHICKDGQGTYPDDAASQLRRIAGYLHSRMNSMADEFETQGAGK